MRIRVATTADRAAVVDMALRFIRETPYATHIGQNRDQLLAFVDRLLSTDGCVIVVGERGTDLAGMIALWTYVHPYSGEQVASELVWWVNPEQRGSLGVRLLARAEAWARSVGATAMQMIAPNDRVGAFYARMGYQPIETMFQRRLA